MHIEIIAPARGLTGRSTNQFRYMSQKLEDVACPSLGQTVGADRRACSKLSPRTTADAVNRQWRVGPPWSLQQEIAAQAAGVELVLNEEWLARWRVSHPPRPHHAATSASSKCCLSTAEVLDTRSAPPAASPSTSARRIFLTPACRASCAAWLEGSHSPLLGAAARRVDPTHTPTAWANSCRFPAGGYEKKQLDPSGAVKQAYAPDYPQDVDEPLLSCLRGRSG